MSEASRLSWIMEIGDLDSNSAQKYYTEYGGIDETVGKELYNVTGGRFITIKEAIDRYQKGRTVKEIRDQLIADAMKQFGDLQIPADVTEITTIQKKIWQQIIKLYDVPNREISYKEFNANLTSKLASDVLKLNIFAYHPSRETVSFQSRPVELFIEDEIGEPGSVKREAFQRQFSLNP